MLGLVQYIGRVSEERTVEVELGQLRLFSKATGERNPIYFDPAVARAAGYRAVPAPPTFAFSLDCLAPAEHTSFAAMGISQDRILHGEQSFQHHAPIHAGDTLRLTTEVVDVYSRKAGTLEFVVLETRVKNQASALCIVSRATIAVRHPVTA